jgi:hypothetical protein
MVLDRNKKRNLTQPARKRAFVRTGTKAWRARSKAVMLKQDKPEYNLPVFSYDFTLDFTPTKR